MIALNEHQGIAFCESIFICIIHILPIKNGSYK